MFYKTTSLDLYSGRPAAANEYLYQVIQCVSLEKLFSESEAETFKTAHEIINTPTTSLPHFGILGYGVDHGVALNNGRIGAAAGPDAFRSCIGKLAYPNKKNIKITDFGSVYCPDKKLALAQQRLGSALAHLLAQGIKPIVIGGGHDMAYGHFLGIQEHLNTLKPKTKLGIINLDAHLDLRMPSPEGTSGSPFSQTATHLAAHGKTFHYCCVGLRENANPPSLIERALGLKSTLVFREECQMSQWAAVEEKIITFIAPLDAVYLSIDLDVFHQGIAPGVSAASPLGLELDFGIRVLKLVLASGKMISMDLAELNPTYDRDQATAKLAAGLAYELIDYYP
jgi:formiminoglutamase